MTTTSVPATVLPLEKMTRAEKLRAMEEIWTDLVSDPEAIESPDWHADVLRETEERYRAGLEIPIEWDEAKKQLLKAKGIE